MVSIQVLASWLGSAARTIFPQQFNKEISKLSVSLSETLTNCARLDLLQLCYASTKPYFLIYLNRNANLNKST